VTFRHAPDGECDGEGAADVSRSAKDEKSTEKVLRQGQVADLLGVPVSIIKELADARRIAYSRTEGGQRRFSARDALAVAKVARDLAQRREQQRAALARVA
jgi:excisionase family DNA binding protein